MGGNGLGHGSEHQQLDRQAGVQLTAAWWKASSSSRRLRFGSRHGRPAWWAYAYWTAQGSRSFDGGSSERLRRDAWMPSRSAMRMASGAMATRSTTEEALAATAAASMPVLMPVQVLGLGSATVGPLVVPSQCLLSCQPCRLDWGRLCHVSSG